MRMSLSDETMEIKIYDKSYKIVENIFRKKQCCEMKYSKSYG